MYARLSQVAFLTFVTSGVLAVPGHGQAPTAAAEAAVTSATSAIVPASAKRKRNLITAEEIRELNATTAYDVVNRLRAGWLRKRGIASLNREGTILVYRDGVRMGSPEVLRQVNATDIESIGYLDGMEATQRFGTDHGNGAILITTRG